MIPMSEGLERNLSAKFLADFEAQRVKPMLHTKYLPVTRSRRIWLFITFRKPPINPEWLDMIERIETKGDTVTVRRPTEYLNNV